MSSFQPYAGSYEIDDVRYDWRCYATARLYDLRRPEHAAVPPASLGRAWIAAAEGPDDQQALYALVDEGADEVSLMLVQVRPRPVVEPVLRRA
jgi:hypothetical protein